MSNCFHMWVQTGRLSDDEFQCLKCGGKIAYKKVDRHNPEPQARKPLTDEEIMKTAKETQSAEPGRDGYILPFAFARAIERAHGIHE